MVGNNAWQAYSGDWIEKEYPNLVATGYKVTSQDTIDYNCVAWAADEDDEWWWPDAQEQYYWPIDVPREETLDGFIKAFQTIGYAVDNNLNSDLEAGFQKIAIYTTKSDGKPTHVARQLKNGNWTSKLGQYEDIEHKKLEGLSGEKYGEVTCIMKRMM
ncbi:MAG: hypothetical protein QNJ65_19335 [Xenococcaceae cyanobacterium MO_234.B1]|nr:hypothetical protein [Xenococcaceae cyanobacterium MO_234.B1]